MSRQHSCQLSSSRFAALLFSGFVCLSGAASGQLAMKHVPVLPQVAAPKVSGRTLPLVFEENAGQLSKGTAFAGRTQDYTVQIQPSELRFGLPGKRASRTVTLSFTGSNGAKPEGITDAGFRTNYYIGNDPKAWHVGVHNFDRVALRQLYPGVDAEFYSRGNEIEHDFMLSPNAEAGQLAMHVAGAKSAVLSSNGDLVLGAEEGALRLHKPNAYQVLADGKRQAVDAQFELAKNGDSADVSFKLGAYDHSRALVIDPVITYATYVTSDKGSTPTSIQSDTQGNVYLTGTTISSSKNFGVTTPSLNPSTGLTDPPGPTVTFVARLSSTDSGSKVAWLTYYGSTTAAVNAGPSALQPNSGPTLVIGGSTSALDLPVMSSGAAPFQAAPTAGTSYGFLASFNTTTGALGATAYLTGATAVATDVTTVGGIALDGTGNVTVVGTTSTATFPTSANALTYNGLSNVIGNPAESKGFVATFDPTLVTESYGTYVAGPTVINDAAGKPETSLNAVALNGGNIYFAGMSYSEVLQAGTYSDSTIGASTYANGDISGATRDVFAAELTPASQALIYTYDVAGTGDDVVNGLSIDSSSNLLLFGNTNSTNFLSAASYSTDNILGGILSGILSGVAGTHYNSHYPAGATSAGWTVLLNNTGGATSSTFLGGGAAGSTTNVTGAIAGVVPGTVTTPVVYLTGTTTVARAQFPVDDSGNPPSATLPGLPGPQDNPSDATDTNPLRSFLLQTDGTIATLNYLANLGTQNGSPASVGLALDTPASGGPNAYVAIFDTPTTAKAYTTASAAEQSAQVVDGSAGSAYVARVAYTAGGTKNTLAVGTSGVTSPTASYGRTSTASSLLALKFEVKNTAAVNNFVFDLPQSIYLSPYSASNFTFSVNGSAMNAACTLGTAVASTHASPALPVNAAPGFTCVVPTLAAASTVDFALTNETLTSQVSLSGGTYAILASAYDDSGTYLDAHFDITPVGVPVLTVSDTVNGAASATVNAATSTTDTTTPAPTQVVYKYTITNTSGNDSPQTVLTTNLNTTNPATPELSVVGTPVTLVNGVAPTTPCDPTSTTGCDIPANGVLTYTVTGVYLASGFGATATTFPAIVTPAPTVAFIPVLDGVSPPPTPPTGSQLSVTVNGNANLAQTFTLSGFTYNKDGFRLGDTNKTIAVTVTNSGTNAVGSYSGSFTLPKGFAISGTAISPGTGTSDCTTTPGTCTFTFTNISGGSTGNVATLTVTGSFQDTGTSADAVAPPNRTAGTPAATTVSGSVAVGAVSTTLSQQAAGTTTYYPVVTATTSNFNVYRVNQLTSSVAATTPAALTANTVDAYSRLHVAAPAGNYNDTVTYTVTIANAATPASNGIVSALRGLYVTIPIVPANITLPSPLVAPSSFQMIGSPTTSDPSLTCTPYSNTTPATSIVCYQTDLVTGDTKVPLNSYTVTYTLAYDQSLIQQLNPGQRNVVLTPQSADAFQSASDIASFTAASPSTPSNYNAAAMPGTAPAQSITLQRQANVTNQLTYVALNSAVPTTLYDRTRLNLDEHTAGDVPGKNDTVVVTSATANAGPNDADGVVITIPLPAYMKVAVPANCTLSTATGPVAPNTLVSTGTTTGATLTCTPPTYADTSADGLAETDGTSGILNASVLASPVACSASPAIALSNANFAGSGYDTGHTCFAVAFYAKFADNADESTTVPKASPFGSVTYTPATLVDNDVQVAGGPTAPAVTFVSTPMIVSVQRAAHVRLGAPIAAPTYTDGSALGVDTTLTPNLPEVGQAANLYNITTHAATGSKVYDCVRYNVAVINDGPNYTNTTSMQYGFSNGTYVPAGNSINPAVTSPVNCTVTSAPSSNSALVGSLGSGTSHIVSLDGYFDLGSLNNANSGQTKFSTLPFSTPDAQDSNLPASSTDYMGSQSLTIVNTPFNDANTAGIGITPVSSSAKVNLIFTNVSKAGITNAITSTALTSCTASGSVNNCFPYGKSPYPPDNGSVRNLYQPGATPTYYQIPTTATVPQAAPSATTNPTSICLTGNSGAFPDVFVKPERVLLWVLKNAALGTTYNPFPAGFPTFTSISSLSGDVTTSVIPFSVASYITAPAPANITFPQIPQAQPGSICGTVNGITTTTTVDATSAATAETFGLLEPVNFPPYVVAGIVAASATSGKGSSGGVGDVYLAVTGTTAASGFTHDYNDRDPCYIATQSTPRQQCDDNPYLAARMFLSGGGTGMTLITKLNDETSTSLPAGVKAKQISVLYSASGTGLYVAVADQATGADSYNTDIAKAPGYSTNPFDHQGNFLTANFSLSTAAIGTAVCDPGTAAFSGYTPTPPACNGGVSAVADASQRYVLGGVENPAIPGNPNYTASPAFSGNYFYLGNVGAQGVSATITGSGGGGSGLIPLPFPDGSTPPTNTSPLPINPSATTSAPLGPAANPTAAMATITAGQTAGFVWPWLGSQTTALGVAAGGAPSDLYDLSCAAYDTATQQQQIPFPAGVNCYISTTTTGNASASATVYTFGSSSPPTIYVTTNGNLFSNAEPMWKRGLEGIALGMLMPVFFFRKRLGKGATLMLLFLTLAAAPLLSGCGSGGTATSGTSGTVTPAGSYYLRVIAKPEKPGKPNIVSAVFAVMVQSGS